MNVVTKIDGQTSAKAVVATATVGLHQGSIGVALPSA